MPAPGAASLYVTPSFGGALLGFHRNTISSTRCSHLPLPDAHAHGRHVPTATDDGRSPTAATRPQAMPPGERTSAACAVPPPDHGPARTARARARQGLNPPRRCPPQPSVVLTHGVTFAPPADVRRHRGGHHSGYPARRGPARITCPGACGRSVGTVRQPACEPVPERDPQTVLLG